MGVEPKIGVVNPPKWMVKIMENPIKMDDLGGFPPIFGNTHMSVLGSNYADLQNPQVAFQCSPRVRRWMHGEHHALPDQKKLEGRTSSVT